MLICARRTLDNLIMKVEIVILLIVVGVGGDCEEKKGKKKRLRKFVERYWS